VAVVAVVVIVVVAVVVPMVAVLRVWSGSSAHICMEATTTGSYSLHPSFRLLKDLTRHTEGLVAAVVGVLVLSLKGLTQLTAAVLVLALRLIGVGT
jgi:choline-glycine betaine transporter